MMPNSTKVQQTCINATVWLAGVISCLLFLQYFSPKCSFPLSHPYKQHFFLNSNISDGFNQEKKESVVEKPILLLWFTPENYIWDYSDCKTVYNIDSCQITDDKSLYNQADAVLIYHKSIEWDLSNLPHFPRPPFQRWIWFHVESPTNTHRIPGLENLFNLTLSYRRDADISVRYWLTVNKTPNEDFVIPKKDKLVCWFVSNTDPSTGIGIRMTYYRELRKYININIFGRVAGDRLRAEDYYPVMSSCKFYLSFENSIHRDYITEKVNGPLSIGTVPVALGPPRQNYEEFYPPNSFIHKDDFPSAKALAKYLLQLDKDDQAYRRFFDWRKHVTATPHLVQQQQEFVIYSCHACQYIARHREYKAAHDLYKWWFP